MLFVVVDDEEVDGQYEQYNDKKIGLYLLGVDGFYENFFFVRKILSQCFVSVFLEKLIFQGVVKVLFVVLFLGLFVMLGIDELFCVDDVVVESYFFLYLFLFVKIRISLILIKYMFVYFGFEFIGVLRELNNWKFYGG